MVYINFTSFPTSDNIFTRNYYPCLGVHYHLNGKKITVKGFVDSGAGYTILDTKFAKYLGINNYRSEKQGKISGISGVIQPVYFHKIELIVPALSNNRIDTWVGFSDIAVALLLGHIGFFEHFNVTVEYSRLRFGLEPVGYNA